MNKTTSVTFSKSSLKGEIDAPSSKSFTHRAIIAASLAPGKSKISNISYSDDIHATIEAVRSYGARVDLHDDYCDVEGVKEINEIPHTVDCHESGSTLRFMIPIFALSQKRFTLTGEPSLMRRPLTVYEKLFKSRNNEFLLQHNILRIDGGLAPGDYQIDGSISSQFLTGLMFALPLLKGDSTIKVLHKLESESYLGMTMDLLKEFGIIINKTYDGYFIKGNQTYKAKDYNVEGDYSQAAFFLVGGQLNGNVKVTNLEHDSHQGDKVLLKILHDMKGRIIYSEKGFISKKTQTYGTTIDLSDCPDLGPILSLIAAVSEGKTAITHIERLRIKESDRVHSTVDTLQKLGAKITATKNDIIVHGKPSLLGGVTVDSHNDHRIAMMVAIAGVVCERPVTLTHPYAIRKSYPDFYHDYALLGGNVIKKGLIR